MKPDRDKQIQSFIRLMEASYKCRPENIALLQCNDGEHVVVIDMATGQEAGHLPFEVGLADSIQAYIAREKAVKDGKLPRT